MRQATATSHGRARALLGAGCLALFVAVSVAALSPVTAARASEAGAVTAATSAPAESSPVETAPPESAPVWSPLVASLRGTTRNLTADWRHVRQVVNWLRYRRPPRRVVYLLGGSGARESVTNETAWSRELRRKLGRPAAAWVLSSNCQSFTEDARIVKALPRYRGVALISVGFTRFNSSHAPASVSMTAVRTTPPAWWRQHRYDTRIPRTLSAKRQLVLDWRADRLRTFTARYPGGLEELHALVHTCRSQGIRPVLLEMPLDTVAVRHDLDDVLSTYREDCKTLAAEHGIRYLDFLDTLSLRSSDFYDLWHLLRSGRTKWQNKLSRELVGKGILK